MRAGQSCLPARVRPGGAYSRRPCRCTPCVQVWRGSRLGPVWPTGHASCLAGPVVGPRLAIDSGRRVAFEREVGSFESLDRVDMVHQRGEPGLPVASRRLSYAIQRAVHVVCPARCPGRVRLNGISLGSRPSLHHLRRRRDFTRSLVRQLPRYYASIRLPASMAHRCTPLGFSMRAAAWLSRAAAAGCGISRFPCEMFPRLLGVSDRAGSMPASPCGKHGVAFGVAPRPRHPDQPAAHAAGHVFRGSIPGPRVPLSTLRPHPCECVRMTRGRRSWLSLQRMTLSFTTSRRF